MAEPIDAIRAVLRALSTQPSLTMSWELVDARVIGDKCVLR
ncbi:MAG: hypothetical protein WCB79_01175 [Halobacteriota archaeon]